MQVREQIFNLLLAEGIPERGHHVAPAEDHGRNAVVVGWRPAGEILLLVECLKPGAMERAVAVRIVAAGAARDIDLVSGSLLGSELA